MSEVNEPHDGELETVSSELSKGLKTCRTVVNNYRALLSSNDNSALEGVAPQEEGSSTHSFEA